jgi:hypothetical protein
MDTLTTGWADDQYSSWSKTFKEHSDNDIFYANDPKDPFILSNKKRFKRTLMLVYLYNVSQAPENTIVPGLKHFDIGYKLNEVTDPNYIQLNVDYWWRRQVDVIDNKQQNSLLRGLWENTIKLVIDKAKANFAGLKDKQVWDSDLNGQILFSDQEDATHSFEGEGVHRETDANQGTMRHLKWILWNMR